MTTTVSSRIPVRFMQRGKQGDPGATGPWLRPVGKFVSGEKYYNNDKFIDVTIVVGNGGVTNYYKLKDYVNGSRQTEKIATTSPDQDLTHWEVANRLMFVATAAIIAGTASIDVLGTGQILIGTYDNQGNPVGWIGTQSSIIHSVTGAGFDADGYITDPDGLHLRVGGKLIDKSVNLLPWATLDDEGFTAGTYMSYETVVGSYTPLGKKMFVINNSSGSSLSYKTVNGDIRVQLKPNTTYRFSVFVSLSGIGYNQNQDVYGTLQLFDAPEDGNYISSSFTSTFAYNGAATQIISWQFTTDSTHTWFIPNLLLPSVLQGRIVIIRGVMLTLGPTAPTAYTPPSITNIIQSALLATGIDIEDQVINLIANQFNCFNNSGVKTAWLDDKGNWTTRGVTNNMIMEIDTTAGSEQNTHVLLDKPDLEYLHIRDNMGNVIDFRYKNAYSLDVLRCPDVVVIKNIDKDLILPFYLSSFIPSAVFPYQSGTTEVVSYARTKTKYVTGVEHLITTSELASLIGRKVYIISDFSGTGYTVYSGSHGSVMEGTAESALATNILQFQSLDGGLSPLTQNYMIALEFRVGWLRYDGTHYKRIYYWATLGDGAHGLPTSWT